MENRVPTTFLRALSIIRVASRRHSTLSKQNRHPLVSRGPTILCCHSALYSLSGKLRSPLRAGRAEAFCARCDRLHYRVAGTKTELLIHNRFHRDIICYLTSGTKDCIYPPFTITML